ncbi:MAG: hypothetical protein Kow00124_00450 [Anaerolineae bacterium]
MVLMLVLIISILALTLSAPVQAQDDGGLTFHVVAWGETLAKIAARYNVTVQAIMAANSISNPDRIYAGQTLIIPGAGGLPITGDYYVVQRGDTLSQIAQRYGLSTQLLAAVNGLVNPSRIEVGQQILLPGVQLESQPSAPTPAVDAPPAGDLPVEDPSVDDIPPAASTDTLTHVVQRGETLAIISRLYGVSLWSLVQANNLSNPSLIYAGQTLVIPDGQGGGGSPTVEDPSSLADGVYIVQPGDTLYRIGLRYGVTVTALLAANNLISADRIEVGQQIIVPGVGEIPAPLTPPPPSASVEGKLILVDLSEQMVYVYENNVLLHQFLVSTGLPATPTVVGDFKIYLKYSSQRMRGPGYDLPGVPWVMYFYKGYGLHGTYWHSNFGQPMSHGCVNMRTDEAAWLYNWAPIGTPVKVQW